DAMPGADDWASTVAVRLQSYGRDITDALSTLPGWLSAAALIGVAAWLARRALRQVAPRQSAAQAEIPRKSNSNRGAYCDISPAQSRAKRSSSRQR
ncbi:MAG: hypothetical protein ACREU7_03700, partial [Burkholderiales bacterium]